MSTAPVAVDPVTGEALSMQDLSNKLVQILLELEQSSAKLGPLIVEEGQVSWQYDALYHATIATSDAKTVDRREAEAVAYCNAKLRDNGESLGQARARLAVEIAALKAGQHNLRSMLSGYQSLSANVRAEITGLGINPRER